MKINLNEMYHFLDFLWEWNIAHPEERYSVIFFGEAGIGKTYSLIDWAKSKGLDYTVVPVAQFNEMGDLIGSPEKDHETKRTVYYPPEWWPSEDFEGIVILDDFNRANNLILQGSLHLLQFHEVVGNKIPPRALLVATANPAESGDYIVQEIDDAVITRPFKFDIKFDPVVWAKQYAIPNKIHDIYIDFILKNPEVVQQPQNIRAWTKIFRTCPPDHPMLNLIAVGAVGEDAAASLIHWIQEEYKWVREIKIEYAWGNEEERSKLIQQLVSFRKTPEKQLFVIRKLSSIDTTKMSEKQRSNFSNFWSQLAKMSKEREFPREFVTAAVHYLYSFDKWFVLDNEELLDAATAQLF